MAFDINGAKEAGYSDAEIVGFLAPEKKFDVKAARESGYNDSEILSFLSEGEKQKPKEKEGALRQAADVPVGVAKGAVQGVRMIADAFGAENPISKNLRGVEDYLGGLMSAQAKDDQQEIARIMKEAEDKGVLEQVKAGIKAFTVAPVDLLSQAFGTIAPVVVGGLAGGALRIGAAATGAATGSAMGAGSIKSGIYDAVKEELSKTGMPPDQIEKRAILAQEYGGENLDQILLGAGIGGLSAVTGAEALLIPGMVKNIAAKAAAKSTTARAVGTGFKEFGTEGLQGSQQQVAQNIALQREGYDVPTFRGAVGAGTMEGLAGFGLGAGVGAFSRPEVPRETLPVAPVQEPVQVAPEAMPEPAAPIVERYQPLSADEARQQSYEQQIARQDARTPVRQYTEPYPQSQFLGVGEAAIQPGQRERAQGLAAQQFGLNVGEARTPITEQDRINRQLAAQQQMDADRFKQQTPRPEITPAQAALPSPAPIPSARGFDRQAELLGQRAGLPQVEQVGLEAQADIAGRTGQTAVPQTRFVDLTPMPPRVARQKLAALQADAPNANLNIVPHPQMGGRFAIEERVTPIVEAAEPRRADRPSVSYEQAVQMVRDVQRTGVLTPEASAAAQQYGLNIDPMLMNFAERTTPDNLLVQQRQGMADEAALNAELRGGFDTRQITNDNRTKQVTKPMLGGVATQEEAQRLREQGMGRPYDQVSSLEPKAPTEIGKSQREQRLEQEFQAEQQAARATLQGPTLQGTSIGARPAPQPASTQFTEQFMKPEGRMSLASAEATPELKATVDDMRKQLLPILKRFGLEKVGLRLVGSIANGGADGMYAKQVITLALDSDNPLGVMRHEVIHALKELGAFTPAEWKTLSKAAKDKWINQFFNRDMQDRYQRVYLEQNGNLDGFQEYLQEEAIAQAFRYFSDKTPRGALKEFQKPSGMIANLMRRLNEFFAALSNFFASKDLTVDDMFLPNRIFADIERGAITPGRDQGRKEGLPEFAAKYSARFSLSGDPTPMSVQKIRVYNKEIEDLTKKIGGRIAGMTSEQTVDDVRKAIKKLQSFTAKGLKGREWYEQSAKAILDAFNGDKVLAEKLFQIIAITSAATEVSANFTKTVNAWNQFANGKPIKVGTGDTNKKIEALLNFGVDWDGRKTNTFYTNLLEAMEGKDTGRSTIDLHMTRMIFGKDQPTDAQYELAENMVRLLASKMDVPPRQVQAASWVTQKAKGMFEDYRKRGLKKNLNDKELREYAFERAVTDYSHLMKAKVTKLPITPELSEPSPDIRARTQTITGEVIPSVKTEMSQMEEMSFPQKDKFTKDVMRSGAVTSIANLLGINSRIRVTIESGGYEGKVNPNLKVQVINSNATTAENDARDLAYAMSYVFKQDATPFFRADPKLLDQEQYGILFKFEKALTPAMQNKILGVMNTYLGNDAGFSKVGPNEIVMINYRGDDGTPFMMSDAEFIDAVAKAKEDINKLVPIEADQAFGAKSEYPYHDWQEDGAGNAIIKRLQNSRANRPNLQKSLNNIRESFISKARDAVEKTGAEAKFSLRYFPDESSQSALRPSPSSNAGISFNPVKEDAVSFQGSHYGKAKTETLNGAKYGQGLRGAEARRLEQSDDERIKRRVYFYIPRSNDTMPNREAGVGGYVYTQKLDNILAPGATMSRLTREAGGDSNKFESLIVDNGYDGYAVPDYGMMVVLNQDVPVNYEGTVDEVHGGKKPQQKFSLRTPTTPEFKQFFKDSKVVDKNGNPLVVYHGTNQDVNEFTTQPSALRRKFYAGEIGSWFGDDPEIANNFAKGIRSPREGGVVYPVFLNIKNPKVYSSYETFLSDAKGRRSAPAMRKELMKQGFDGIHIKDSDTDLGGRRDDWVAFNPNQVKSAFNQQPTSSPDIRFSLRQQKTPEFKRFFGNSKITNPDGTPKVMYHGTARIIDEFIPKQAGAIFVTDNPEFAGKFSEDSVQYMVNEQIKQLGNAFAAMDPANKIKFLKKGLNIAVKEKAITRPYAKRIFDRLDEDFNNNKYPTQLEFNGLAEFFRDQIKKELEVGQNIMPLYVRAENPFDYENPEHIQKIRPFVQSSDVDDLLNRSSMGFWQAIESDMVQDAIKDAGFDSFYVSEGGNKNLAVYNPNQIKSATGNRGTFDESGRILYSLKNAPPNRYTKLAESAPTTGEAITKVATSAFNAVRNDGTRTSARINLVDRFAGVSKTLSPLPLFSDGVLRADMLHHAKAQGINLIKGGLVSGIPVLNEDGTIGIQISENNLARAAYLADKLDTNQNVVDSGLSGRAYMSEVARILRGMDIIEEDKATRALGEQQISDANFFANELKKELKAGNITATQVVQFQGQIDKLREEGNANRKVNRELQVKPEDIAWAQKQLQITPEVQEILDIWKAVNTSLVDLWENVGLLDKETADKYRAAKNYVPLFKSREDLNEEGFFRTGTGAKTTAKIKALKGATDQRNILENIDKQYATMIAAAYENQTRRVSVEQMRGISEELAEITNASDPRVNLRYRDNGKDVHVVIENPNDLAAFQSMTYQLSPIMKAFGGFTKVLRAGALLNPMFWIRQLIRDPISATLTGQAGIVTPFHSAKEFLSVITRNSEEAKILASRGVIGQFDSTVTLQEYLGNVGKDKQQSPGMIQRGLHRLLEIHEASDAATRIAIYKKAKAKALKDGMSESQAVDYAVFKARESINFALTGNSPTLANLRQMIPFLNATIVGLDTLYRAATGYGLNPEEKAKVQRMFATRAMMMVAMTVAYAASLQDDDDYKKLPDYVKDGNWLIPMSTESGKQFVKLTVPYEVGFLFKTLPEVFVRYMSGTSTGKEALASIRSGFIQNMPTGGVPVPQAVRPLLEVVTNHSFFTNRPIEGMGDSRLPVAERGQRASEFAKMMSGLGLDKLSLSPAKIDVLTKGYFAELGAFFNELSGAVINTATGKEPTPKNVDNAFSRAFLTDPSVNKAISDFYDIERSAQETANLFNDMKKQGRGEDLRALLADPEKRMQVGISPTLNRIQKNMSDINAAIRIIDRNQSIPPQERRAKINELQGILGKLAEKGNEVAGIAGLTR